MALAKTKLQILGTGRDVGRDVGNSKLQILGTGRDVGNSVFPMLRKEFPAR